MSSLNIFLLVLIILFGIIVCLTIHEFGHFVFAKIFKVNVKEFSIGFGPALWRTYTKKNNMRISLRILPIGAYVLMDSAAIRKMYLDEPNSKRYNFYLGAKPYGTKLLEQTKYWQQMIIMFGGIFFNLIAFCIFLIIYSLAYPNTFLQFGDFIKNLFINIGQAFVLYGIWPKNISDTTGGSGVAQSPFSDAIANPDFLLRYIISINLATAILNVIPIAPLDGWKIMQSTYEKVTKRKLPSKLLNTLSIIGVILILWITIGSVVNQFV